MDLINESFEEWRRAVNFRPAILTVLQTELVFNALAPVWIMRHVLRGCESALFHGDLIVNTR